MNKKTIYSVILAGIFLFLATAFIQASLEDSLKKYNIAFPIAELGNCTDFSSCRSYCDDPINKDTCIAYAKKKGFYKEEEINQRKSQIMAAAQVELGCNSMASCKNLCENEVNFEKCTEFAKRHGLGGGQILSPKNQEILSKARTILGCDSPSSCKALCEKPENRQKCTEFAKQTGLKGGVHMQGPGGCTSEETCQAYCSEPVHREECSKFGPGPEGMEEGPPCTSDDECRAYCQDHPEDCPEGGPGPSEEEYCQLHPDECKYGPGAPDYAAGEGDFCSDHPEECPGPGSLDPEKEGFEEHCKKHPEDCIDIPRPTESTDQLTPEVQGFSTVRNIFGTLTSLISEKIKSLLSP